MKIAPTPWRLIREHGKDLGPFIVDANGNLVDVRKLDNGQFIVDSVNASARRPLRNSEGETTV